MLIVWDELKRLSNIDKHGFNFADLAYDFFLEGVVLPARYERLIKVIGRMDDECSRWYLPHWESRPSP